MLEAKFLKSLKEVRDLRVRGSLLVCWCDHSRVSQLGG